jgi:hypothetical protein
LRIKNQKFILIVKTKNEPGVNTLSIEAKSVSDLGSTIGQCTVSRLSLYSLFVFGTDAEVKTYPL